MAQLPQNSIWPPSASLDLKCCQSENMTNITVMEHGYKSCGESLCGLGGYVRICVCKKIGGGVSDSKVTLK